MKKTVKIILVALGGLVLGIAGFSGWFAFQMREMHLLSPSKLSENVYVLKGEISNMFIMNTGEGYIAFDASDNPEKLVAGCKELSIDPQAVKAVFLTHTDGDHVNGLPVFSNAVVYVPAEDELLLTNKKYRHFMGMEHQNELPVDKYIKVNDGDSLCFGGCTIHAIATPGHTRGSTCYRVGGALFTGDLLMLVDGMVQPMIKIFTEDMTTDSLSIRKIAGRNDITHLYTSHSGYSSDIANALSTWK